MSLGNWLFVIVMAIWVDASLSIDNAGALAGVAQVLPNNVPPPRWARFFGSDQRAAALKAGIIGAWFGRAILLVLAGTIIYTTLQLQNASAGLRIGLNVPVPFWPLAFGWTLPQVAVPAFDWTIRILGFLGAFYLLKLSWGHFFGSEGEDSLPREGDPNRFVKTVVAIELTDLAFSLDNITAVAAISSNIWAIIVGVCISIVMMRFVSQVFLKLIEVEPWLIHAAFLLIAAVGVELAVRSATDLSLPDIWQFAISVLILIGTVLVAQRFPNRFPKKEGGDLVAPVSAPLAVR